MLKKKRRRSLQYKNESRAINTEEARKKRKEKRAANDESSGKPVIISAKRARKKAKTRLIYSVVLIALISLVLMAVYSVFSLKMEEQKVTAEKNALLNEKSKLQYELKQIDSLEYVEQQARELLKMIKPGEILYILPEKESKN